MKKSLLFFVFLTGLFSLFAQSDNSIEENLKSKESVRESIQMIADPQLAMSVPDYPVTAGDVYALSFYANGNAVRYAIPVDSTYKIRVANLGILTVRGLTYNQLKQQVELLVNNNYPMSGVQFVLSAPAVFLVSISGEVSRAYEEKAWALTRLSSFVTSRLTPYSSTRDITVINTAGKTTHYDLFKAQRGDFSQDPYLRPGDKIILNRAERKVHIGGAVERAGTYEILPGENLKKLVDFYANGLTEYADTKRMFVHRVSKSSSAAGDTLYLPEDALDKDFTLETDDRITIPSRTELRDTMFFEGAVGTMGREIQNGAADSETPDANSYAANSAINRIPVSFLDGENLASLIRRNSNNFFPTSDLRGAYLIRGGEKLAVNIEDCLYTRDYMSEYTVQKGDTLFVPYMQHFSTITLIGEVKATVEVPALPLKRLRTLVSEYRTEYGSLRHASIKSIDGVVTDYDLFQAERFGDMDQNPYVKAGETVIVKRYERRVSISGAIERSGTYELEEGENLKNLIEYYGNGLAPLADSSRVEVYRQIVEGAEAGAEAGLKFYLSQENIDSNFELRNYDSVSVSSFKDLAPVMFFEGAVKVSEDATLENSNKFSVNFNIGEDYAFLTRRYKNCFGATSDIQNAYVLRGEEKIPMDLRLFLYDAAEDSKVLVKEYDRLIIPFKQYFVSVSGAVKNPGRYPYIPDRKWDYYIGLAGGFIKTQNSHDSIKITDVEGKKQSKKNFIQPEMTIEAATNSALYYFNQYAPVLTTILSLIATSISVLVVSGAL